MNLKNRQTNKLQITDAKINNIDLLLLFIMWVAVFLSSIISLGVWSTYLFVLLNFILVVRNTFNGILVMLLIFFSPTFSLIELPVGIFRLSILLIFIKFFLVDYLTNSKNFNFNRITSYAFLFILYISLSLTYSTNYDVALVSLKKYFEGLIVVIVFFAVVDSYQKLGCLLKFWAIIAGCSFFIKLAHYYYGSHTALYQILKNVDMGSNVALKDRMTIMINGNFVNRLLWPGQEPNYSSSDLIFPFAIALGYFSVSKSVTRYLWLIIAALTSIAAIGTYSRSGFISIVIVFILFIIGGNKKILIPSILVSYCIAALVFSIPELRDRIFSIDDEINNSGSGRFELWHKAIDLWLSSPIFGNGLGSYYDLVGAAHNTYLQILAETGILGLGIFITLIILTILFCLRLKSLYPYISKKDINLSNNLLYGLIGVTLMLNTITYQDIKLFWLTCATCAAVFYTALKNKRSAILFKK